MKRCSLFCGVWWPFLLLPLLLFLLFGLYKWRHVETDVAANAQQQLAQSNNQWAKAETFHRGRDVLIYGSPPNEEAITQAKAAALKGEGVRVVDFLREDNETAIVEEPVVAPESAPVVENQHGQLSISWENNKVILNGALSSQAEIDALAAEAASVYGLDRVDNRLVLGEQIDPLPSHQNLFPSLEGLSSDNIVNIIGNVLTLNGSVDSEEIKTSIGNKLTALFDGKIDNQLIVVNSPEVVAELPKPQCEALNSPLIKEAVINFTTGSAVIHSNSHELLKKIANEISSTCSGSVIEIAGHTDSTGDPQRNKVLSQQRAQAVVNYFVNTIGLDANHFVATGYGQERPIADNDTASGRAKNRRIEFTIKN